MSDEAHSPDPQKEEEAHTPKYVELEEPEQPPAKAMQCLLPPHKPLTFATYNDYQAHYYQSHTNRCRECQKNLPTPHFLELHLSENHDPIVAAKRDRGERTFGCFVEGCEKVCSEWQKRRSHLVDKHGFPKNYDFFIVNNGIDGRRSMLRPGVDAQGHRRSSCERRGSTTTASTVATEATTASQDTQRTERTEPDESEQERHMSARGHQDSKKANSSVDTLTKSFSSLQFVPRSVTFGKRKGKSGFAKS